MIISLISSIGTRFGENSNKSNVTSFDEFRYFIGLKGEMLCDSSNHGDYSQGFRAMINLQYITLPLCECINIGLATFNECTNLKRIIIPSNYTNMGWITFRNCPNLSIVVVLNVTPPKMGGTDTFKVSPDGIYVPDDSVEAYKSATNWNYYSSKIKPLSEYTE